MASVPRTIIADLHNGSDVDLLFRNGKHLKGIKMSLDHYILKKFDLIKFKMAAFSAIIHFHMADIW